jgi:hypothetical protein
MSLADGGVPDDQLLRRYLTGSLPDEQAERFDDLSVSDDEFAARLRAAENDLIDAYVNGDLSGETLDRFRLHYLASPASREKVRFAETFATYQKAAANEAARPVPVARRRAVSFGWAQGSLAAAALLALAAAGYLLAENARLQNQIEDSRYVRGRLEERERQLQTQLTEQRSASAETAKELAKKQGSVELGILSFTLRAATRGPSSVQTVAIPTEAATVRLQLPLEPDDFPRYDVALQEAGTNQTVWRGDGLPAISTGGVKVLSVTVPARLLQPRFYTIEVTGVPAAGAPQYLSSYPFRVVRQ